MSARWGLGGAQVSPGGPRGTQGPQPAPGRRRDPSGPMVSAPAAPVILLLSELTFARHSELPFIIHKY